ncbi:MAG: hypothetical protein JXB00_00160 [Bacteroidales bacterium]|nr:hypothetical protein [Bacteroidales bacterium]
MPFSFTVSEQQRSFRQPINMIGVSPYYKWFTLHLGYQNLSFGQYTLAGNTMLGAGFEIKHPKGLYAGFMTGRFNKAIDYDPDPNEISQGYVVLPEYKRTGNSFKLGYVTDSTCLAISFLKAADDEKSINKLQADSLKINPAQNVVIGLSAQHYFTKKLVVNIEYGNSVYTQNMNDSGPASDLGVIGKGLSGMLVTNGSTISSQAFESSFAYKEKWYGVRFRYKRIGDGYQTMGAYYFQNDVRNITLEPWVQLWKKMLRINASAGIQKNNLKNESGIKSERTVKSLRINFRPAKFYLLNATYSNYEIDRTRHIERLDSIYQQSSTTKNFGFNQNFNFNGEKHQHMIMTGYNYMQLTNADSIQASYSDYHSNTFMVSYQYGYQPMNINMDISYNYNEFKMQSTSDKTTGIDAGFYKSLFKNNLKISLNQSWNKQFASDEPYRQIQRTRAKVTYRIDKRKHYFTLRYDFTKAKGLAENVKDYKLRTIDFGYQYNF